MKWKKQQPMDESFHISEDLMSVHGVLLKKGSSLVKKYKKRWFVMLDNVHLMQYCSAPNSKPLGQIDINSILSVDSILSHKKSLHGFRITTSARIYTFYARTMEERDGWCRCLNHRLRVIATTKLSIQQAPIPLLNEDDERNCQTLPKVTQHRHSNSTVRDKLRESPRRALSDGMLRSANTKISRYSPSFQQGEVVPEITVAYYDRGALGSTPNPPAESKGSKLSINGGKAPINISDDSSRFNIEHVEPININISSISRVDEEKIPISMVNSPEMTSPLDESVSNQNSQLMAKVARLEHMCEEKDATIAALSAMLKRQSMASDLVRFRNSATTLNSPTNTGKKVQQHMDEFVGISIWLEQKKKSELAKDVQQLRESNEELSALLEEQRQKVMALEQEKYNMQCMIDHLEKDKLKT